MSRHSKKTLLILGAIVFVLLYITLVRAASVRKPDPRDVDGPLDLDKLPAAVAMGLPDGALLAQREAENGGGVLNGEEFIDGRDGDDENGNADLRGQLDDRHNEAPKDQNEEGKEGEEEEEEDEGEEEEDEREEKKEAFEDEDLDQIDRPGIKNLQKVEDNQEEGDGAGDELGKPSGPKDSNKLQFHRVEEDDIALDPGANNDIPRELKIEDIQPPDHMDAVRMEQDGHLNRDYKKEIFLGNHEELEQGTDEELEEKLRDIFFRVDSNSDGRVNQGELEEWILAKVEEHFQEAAEENENIFASLDMDKDGFIGWKEFHYQFLKAKGYKETEIAEGEHYDAIPLDPAEKEMLIRYKFRWAEADEEPQDNKLTIEEFKSFRHPEQSQSMMVQMVEEILSNLDINPHDDLISEDEFAALPPGEEYDQLDETDKSWQAERKKEFREMIDLNHDGMVGKDELMKYVDPKNPNHSRMEAENLVEMADENNDGELSLTEVLRNKDLFFGSKVVDTGRNFHDEF